MLEGRRTKDEGRNALLLPVVYRLSSIILRSTVFIIPIFLILISSFAQAAEPYFITIQKLELRQRDGEWVTIAKPDHRVDLMSTDAVVSFFNNGRVPEAEYDNFKLTFDDRATTHEITRKLNYPQPLPVRKDSFIRVWFVLDFERDSNKIPVRPSGVQELRLTVDDIIRIDDRTTLEL